MVSGDQITSFSLTDYRGKKVILYFYPKDDTPGCTKEACAFRDGFSQFQNAGLTVLGCSIDSEDAHKKFIKKYNLPFPLLLDPDQENRHRIWRRQRHSDPRTRQAGDLRHR